MADQQQPGTVNAPKGAKGTKKPKRRRGRGLFNLLLIIGIIAAIGLFVWAEQQRRSTEQQLEQTAQELEEIRRSTQRGGQELADEVLGKLRTHMRFIEDPQPTVATIVDIEALRQANEFYNSAENGDHLIITQRRAILYDPEQDIVLDVVPVVINQEDQNSIPEEGENPEGEEAEGEEGTSPSPEASPEGSSEEEQSPSPTP